MNVTDLLRSPECERLLVTFAHFLWQGFAITAVTALAALQCRRSSAQSRYLIYTAALSLMAVAPVATYRFLTAIPADNPQVQTTTQPLVADHIGPRTGRLVNQQFAESTTLAMTGPAPPDTAVGTQPPRQTSAGTVPGDGHAHMVIPVLTATYLIGVLVLLGRLLFGLRNGWILRRRSRLVQHSDLLAVLERQARALKLNVTPAVAWCEQLAIPIVVGVFRPTILLPLSFASGLTPDQVSDVLTHELAHIRRCDHLVNLLQRVVESLLFFHPAVWWVSYRMRLEREHCCDDIVVSLGAEPLQYAASLLHLAEQGRHHGSGPVRRALALHATGHSQLGNRIRRLAGVAPTPSLQFTRGTATLCVALILATTVATAFWNPEGQADPSAEAVVNDGTASTENSQPSADAPPREPRDVVQRWINLTRQSRSDDAAELTTGSANLEAHYGFNNLEHSNDVRITRSLAAESAAAVVTNVVQDVYGDDYAFVFWLRRRDGEWRINESGMDDPEKIDERLRGFLAGGNVHWDITAQDIMGNWLCGPCFVAATGHRVCGSHVELHEDDSFTLKSYDPAGDATVESGTWRLEQDRLILDGNQEHVTRVWWIGPQHLTLLSADGTVRTEYRRARQPEDPPPDAENLPDATTRETSDNAEPAASTQSFTHIRNVVDDWIELVRTDKVQDSFELTTKSIDLGGQITLRELWNRDDLQVQRSLANDSVAMVVTNTVQDNAGRDRAMAFRLVQRDDKWLIDACDWNDPANIDEQIRGFQSHGDVRWHVTEDDIIGTWVLVGFVRDQYTFSADGTLKNTYRGVERIGSWQLAGDQLTTRFGDEATTARITGISEGELHFRYPDGNRGGFVRPTDQTSEILGDILTR